MEHLLVGGLVRAARTTSAEGAVVSDAVVVVCPLSGGVVEVVGWVPPVLWAAVEVEPDEQRLDLEGVELGLRALWEAVATDLVEDIRIPNSMTK